MCPAAAGPRTSAETRLGDYLLAAVRAADSRVPADRRVPRTAAAMRARIAERTGGVQ